MKTFVLSISFVLFTFICLKSQIIHIPDDQPTIQAGIDASSNGDTVLVADGIYLENINYNGKAILLASHFIMDNDTNHVNNTVIDGSQPSNPDMASVVTFNTGEDSTSILCGFTITGGTGLVVAEFDMKLGGGVGCESSGAKIVNNKILNNQIVHSGIAGGGGIGCVSEYDVNWLVIRDNIIHNNECSSDGIEAMGGGIFSGTNVIIENNNIHENTCTGTNTAESNGGGILLGSQSNSLKYDISNNLIQKNSCTGYTCGGGGIIIWYSEGIFSGNQINRNSGIAEFVAQGGGLMLRGSTGEVDLLDNEFLENTLQAHHVQGGGAQITESSNKVNIENNVFQLNSIHGSDQVKGGGIMLDQNQKISVISNFFQGNSVQGGMNAGAGIFGKNFMDVFEIRNNEFISNNGLQGGFGGGVSLFDSENIQMVIDGNVFKENSISNGGGLYTYNCFNLKILNNVFSGNKASLVGGAIRFRYYSTEKEVNHHLVINNTFYNNTASHGGALYSDHEQESLIVANSIFWENDAQTGKDIYQNGNEIIHVYFNDVDTNFIVGNWIGIGNIFEDPLFTDPTNTDFHIGSCESKCVNAGIESLEINETVYFCPETDMDHGIRPFENTMPDIGAYETSCLENSAEDFWLPYFIENLTCNPNPFTGKMRIEIATRNSGFVTLSIADFTGKVIQTVASGNLKAGTSSFEWNSEGLPPGVYFCTLRTNRGIQTKKLIKRQ